MKRIIDFVSSSNGIVCFLLVIILFVRCVLKIRYLSVKNIVRNHINCFRNPQGKILFVPIFMYIILPFIVAVYIARKKIVDKDILNNITIIISILTAMLFALLTVIMDMKEKVKINKEYSASEAEVIKTALKQTYYTVMFEILISVWLLVLCLINTFVAEYTLIQSVLIYYLSLLMVINLLMVLKRISAVLDVEMGKG